MLKRLTTILISLALAFPASATVIFKDPNQPTLIELQKGIDACNAGDEANCKYERYPGVVRINSLGNKVGPNDPRYILGDVLKPGTVLPRVENPQALLNAIKNKNKVTIVSYLFSELQVASNEDLGDFLTDYVRHAAIPSEIVELAEQNGISAIQMYEHLAVGLEHTTQQIVSDLQAQHEIVVAALEGQLAELSEQIANLELAISNLEAEHALAISSLESEIDRLRSEGVALALENKNLRDNLEVAISELTIARTDRDAYKAQLDQLESTEGRDWNVGDNIPGVTRNATGELVTPHNSVSTMIGAVPNGDGSIGYTGLLRKFAELEINQNIYLDTYIGASYWQNIIDVLEDALQESYDNGYADGYADGYTDGYTDGLADGRAGK